MSKYEIARKVVDNMWNPNRVETLPNGDTTLCYTKMEQAFITAAFRSGVLKNIGTN